MLLLTSQEARRLDEVSIRRDGIPSAALMENAGQAVFEAAVRRYAPLAKKRVYVLCGPGNNGCDGLATARLMALQKASVRVFFFSDPQRFSGAASEQFKEIQTAAVPFEVCAEFTGFEKSAKKFGAPDLIVDALFGTGLSRPLAGVYRQAVQWMNRQKAPVLSADLPSGLCADTGKELGESVTSDLTVTFGFPKRGMFFESGTESFNELVVAPIGFSEKAIAELKPQTRLIDRPAIEPLLKSRPKNAHKGSFGHAFTVACSTGKAGAGVLAAYAALQAGAGLSTLILPEPSYRKISPKALELMYEPVADGKKGFFTEKNIDETLELLGQATVAAMGPGLGTQAATTRFVQGVVARYEGPLVLDADGINAVAVNPDVLRKRAAPTLLTPHPGEMGRLIRQSTAYVQANRLKVASEFAKNYGVYLLLKGYRSLLAFPDGTVWVNPTGNAAMASAGQGDTLTGIYAGLLAQYPLSAYGPAALQFGCFLHGLVGDLLARQGKRVVMANEIANNLHAGYQFLKADPQAFCTMFY